MLRYGIVDQIDYKRAMVRVVFSDLGLLSPWLQVPQRSVRRDKSFSMPDLGEQVAVLLDEHGDRGVLIGATYNAEDEPPEEAGEDVRMVVFDDGTKIKYDRENHKLEVHLKGGETHVEVRADKIDIGHPDGLEPVVLGDKLADWLLGTLKAYIDSHTHTGNLGAPTSPPLIPLQLGEAAKGGGVYSDKNRSQ